MLKIVTENSKNHVLYLFCIFVCILFSYLTEKSSFTSMYIAQYSVQILRVKLYVFLGKGKLYKE